MVELAPNEKVITVVHRHWFVLLSFVITIVIMVGVPVIALVFLLSGKISILPNVLREILISKIAWGAFAYSIYIAFLWILLFVEWTNFYLDTWILTNERIVSVDQRGFFNREVTTLRYAQIQDVTVEMKGLIPSFLKFGLIEIETAGETRKLVLRQAADPEGVKALIIAEQGKGLHT